MQVYEYILVTLDDDGKQVDFVAVGTGHVLAVDADEARVTIGAKHPNEFNKGKVRLYLRPFVR
jgi:uncharacterized protein (DUF1786 family)